MEEKDIIIQRLYNLRRGSDMYHSRRRTNRHHSRRRSGRQSPLRWFILIGLICSGPACERDILDNYRKDYSGQYEFTTIREDLTTVPPGIIDTTIHTGIIEPVYSNRKDLVRIGFLPGLTIDAIVSESAFLSLPALPPEGSSKYLNGYYTDGGSGIEFSYRIVSGQEYSVNHTVRGIRK